MLGMGMITKLAGGAALVAIFTLATLWQLSERRADRLAGRLEATRLDLAQCRENVSTLETSIEAQNTAIQTLQEESATRMAETQERLSRLNTEAERARSEANRLRNRPIQGDTVCERMLDVDAAFVEGLE
jgi:septal ring factor EnvC (AmiA/AmiB activator)